MSDDAILSLHFVKPDENFYKWNGSSESMTVNLFVGKAIGGGEAIHVVSFKRRREERVDFDFVGMARALSFFRGWLVGTMG